MPALVKLWDSIPWDDVVNVTPVPKPGEVNPQDVLDVLRYVGRNGFSLSVGLADGEMLPYGVAVLKNGGVYADRLLEQIRKSIASVPPGNPQPELNEVEIGDRHVFVIRSNDPETFDGHFAWWLEGRDLVFYLGKEHPSAKLEAAADPERRLANLAAWKRAWSGERPDFVESFRVWLNAGRLFDRFGAMPVPFADQPVTIADVVKPLGVDVDSIAFQSGYRGRHLYSNLSIVTDGPRRGLLSLYDHPPLTLADLPPLPPGVTSFHVQSLDPQATYQQVVEVIDGFVGIMPEAARANWIKFKRSATQNGEFNVEEELLTPLGHVLCMFNDTQQEVFGWGRSTIVMSVDDPKVISRTLEKWAKYANEHQESVSEIRKLNQHGVDMYAIVADASPMTFCVAVVDGWLVFGMQPQTVEAFILRQQKKLPSWNVAELGEENRRRLPDSFTALGWSDPRGSVRFVMSLAPWLADMMRMGASQAGAIGLEWKPDLSSLDIPPVEVVLQPLFPNITVTTVEDDRIVMSDYSSTHFDRAIWWITGVYAGAALITAGEFLGLGIDPVPNLPEAEDAEFRLPPPAQWPPRPAPPRRQ